MKIATGNNNWDVPGLDEVPVRQVLLLVIRVRGAGPVHQVEIDIIKTKALEGGVNTLLDTVVPGVVQLGGHPDLFAGNTRLLDTLANLCFVAIGKSAAHPLVSFFHGTLECPDQRILLTCQCDGIPWPAQSSRPP